MVSVPDPLIPFAKGPRFLYITFTKCTRSFGLLLQAPASGMLLRYTSCYRLYMCRTVCNILLFSGKPQRETLKKFSPKNSILDYVHSSDLIHKFQTPGDSKVPDNLGMYNPEWRVDHIKDTCYARGRGVSPYTLYTVSVPLERVSLRKFYHTKGFTFDILPYKGVHFWS